MKETWKTYLKSESKKDKQRKRKTYRATTKRFWQNQSFGAASDVRHIQKTPQAKAQGVVREEGAMVRKE